MKYFFTLLLVGLVACTPRTSEKTSNYALPEELKDCKIYRLLGESGSVLVIMRCPNSTTSVHQSKRSPTITYED